jgi:hypothetical protein
LLEDHFMIGGTQLNERSLSDFMGDYILIIVISTVHMVTYAINL